MKISNTPPHFVVTFSNVIWWRTLIGTLFYGLACHAHSSSVWRCHRKRNVDARSFDFLFCRAYASPNPSQFSTCLKELTTNRMCFSVYKAFIYVSFSTSEASGKGFYVFSQTKVPLPFASHDFLFYEPSTQWRDANEKPWFDDQRISFFNNINVTISYSSRFL